MRWLARLFAALFGSKTPPVPAVASCALGVCTHRNSEGEIAGVQALGVGHARVTIYTLQSGDLASWAWKMPQYDAAGLSLLIVVHDPINSDDMVTAMAALTRKYQGRTWQVGNEADADPAHYAGTGKKYAALMRRVIAACPVGTQFAGMALATTWKDDDGRWTAFLKDYLAAGGPTLAAWCGNAYRDVVAQAAVLHRALNGRMPVWITEFGTEHGDDAQIALLATVPTFAKGGVSRAYWYCYWDAQDEGFGLVRYDDAHRPAWERVRTIYH